jgi:hypothetical protein
MSKIAKLQNVVKCGKYVASQSLQILYTFLMRAEIATTFGPKMVAISARNTKVHKICKLCKAIFSAFYNILQLCNFTHFSILFLAVVIYLHLLA